ncbi:restriction endonuclease subunit M [Arenimonas donghaensis]|uniref:Uncharacterized protein n=1 Tax=Arenimonas donghaensis DSM 18148 = HO3-R19 TaxID=1121014 RepID=A0A087MIL7_9GAMM|nr:N-6 DNA methylase [Arenimonas donghaensis]KFL36720.1 hypothetical protein N788_03675 [Arenimonas donghaensis DSM 18148 = HO3-R19]
MALIADFYVIPPEEWLFATHRDVMTAKARVAEYFKLKGSLDGAERQIEEFVRQWALRQLLHNYKYPMEWIGEQIVIEEPVKMGSSTKEADISLKNKAGRTFLYLEVKKRGVDEAEFHEAERQLETYLASTHTATIGLVTDGDRVRCVRKKIDPNDFEYIPDIPAFGGTATQKALLVRELPPDPQARPTTGLKVITEQYERRLFEVHSAIRDIDGLHDDEALDELAKVLYTKIYDERFTCEQPANTPFRFQVYGTSNPSEAASTIRELYDDARKRDIEIYSQRIPGYERSRGVFKSSIRLSDTCLYRVVELLQEFSLVDTEADIKGRAFQKVLGPAIRAGMGQYFTPDPVVEIAVRIARPKAADLILDPFCGSGHFLTRSLDYVSQNQKAHLTEYAFHQFKFFHLHGIEKSERMVRIAMTDMLMHDDGHTNIRNTDSLLSFDNYPDIIALREDNTQDPAIFDLILTNPPFGSLLGEEARTMLGRFSLPQKKKSVPLEVLAIERCYQFLKPGGRMAIVLPDGNLGNSNVQFVRDWLLEHMLLRGVVSLPSETFAPFGTTTKTSLCLLQKKPADFDNEKRYDVAFYLLENIGYDATGRPRAGSEVEACITHMCDKITWELPE